MAEFALEDLQEVFVAFPEGSDPLLVGGQALNFWATRYAQAHPELLDLQPFTSSDLDVLNSDADAEAVARHLGYEIRKPGKDHHTPERAKIARDFEDPEALVVDFMWDLWRLDPDEVRKWALPTRMQGLERSMHVMHPMHCYISRVEAHFDASRSPPLVPPVGSRALRRVRLSMNTLALYLEERVTVEPREIYKMAELAGEQARKSNQLLAWSAHKLDILGAIPTSDSLAKEFLEIQLPKLKEEAAEARDKYRQRRQRVGRTSPPPRSAP